MTYVEVTSSQICSYSTCWWVTSMVLQTVSDLGVQAWVSITTSSTLQLGARGRARGAAARGTWGAALARPRERTDATKNCGEKNREICFQHDS